MNKRLVITLALFLTSCMGPVYEPQPVEVPTDWRLPADESSTLCNLRWWEAIGDPVLDQMIVTALQNNQDLKVAIARVFQYYDRMRIVSANLLPFVDGNGMFTRAKNSLATPVPIPTGINRILNDYELFFSLSWELDFWGRVRSATEASYAELLSKVEARKAVVISVVSAVANGYIRLRELDAQLEIAKKTLESRQNSLRLAIFRFETGETSELEVKQAESELEIAAISMIVLEREIPQQENLLSILMGENPHEILRGSSIDAFQYPITIPAGLPSDLLVRRPDIMEAEQQLIAANARVWEARALLFPQISLTGSWGVDSWKLRNLITDKGEMWQISTNAAQTLFDSGKTCYLIEETKAIRDQLLFNYRQTILNAFREVDDALVAYQKNLELIAEHERQVNVLKEYLHLARLQYTEGEVDYLNILDAERSLFRAELDLVAAQADSFQSVVKLYGALGGGWVTDADHIATGEEDLCEENLLIINH